MPMKKSLAKTVENVTEELRQKKSKGIKPEHYFILCSGGKITDIRELALNLDGISDADFYHHVNHQRNDFSAWIRDIFKEKELAERLLPVKDKKEVQIVLLKHLLKKE